MTLPQTLPQGVVLTQLQTYPDSRGTFCELFRQSWVPQISFVQWNLVVSEANSLRGVHVHFTHSDYLTVVQGHLQLGLIDLRGDSPTVGLSVVVDLRTATAQTILIPPGVAHGFWFPEQTTCLFGVSHYWDVDDEKGCLYSDPELGFGWENLNQPMVSAKDARLPSLKTLRESHPLIRRP